MVNKSDIEKLPDDKLVEHFIEYRQKLNKALKRHYLLQYNWAKDEIDKRGLVKE